MTMTMQYMIQEFEIYEFMRKDDELRLINRAQHNALSQMFAATKGRPQAFKFTTNYINRGHNRIMEVVLQYYPVKEIREIVWPVPYYASVEELTLTTNLIATEKQVYSAEKKLKTINDAITKQSLKLNLYERLKLYKVTNFLDWLTYKAFGY